MKILSFINKIFSKKNILDIQEICKKNAISNIQYKRSYDDYFQLYIKTKKKQNGGSTHSNIKISSNKYTFHVDEYDTYGDKIFAIIKINAKINKNKDDFEEDDYCGYMIIDENNKSATIQSLSNYSSCIKCVEKNVDFKVGDILLQIMLITAKNKGIDNISITDNSQLTCFKYNFQLIYLRTLTHGRPLYTKYKFIPVEKINYDICVKNHEIFNKNPTISLTRLKKIINKYINKNKVNEYTKYVIKLYDTKEKFIISDLFKTMIADSKTNNNICELIYFIYKPIYYYANYVDYADNNFYLNLKNMYYKK
jgi:hypothetical protein